MKCNYCDYEVSDTAVYCPNCGENVNTKKKNKIKETIKTTNESDNKKKNRIAITSTTGTAVGWGVLGFFIPLVGLILFVTWKNNYPENAKGAGIGALIRICIRIMFFFLTFIVAILSNL